MKTQYARGENETLSLRVVVEHWPHHLCHDTGHRQTCSPCGGTGEAGIAFVTLMRAIDPHGLDGAGFSTVVGCYVRVKYGSPDYVARAAQVATVLEHAACEAGLTVWALGEFDQLWNWLCSAESEHCADLNPDEFPR